MKRFLSKEPTGQNRRGRVQIFVNGKRFLLIVIGLIRVAANREVFQAMARPRKGEEKNRPVHLGFRVSEEINQALRRLAEKRGTPMSDLVVEILERGLRDAARADGRRGKASR